MHKYVVMSCEKDQEKKIQYYCHKVMNKRKENNRDLFRNVNNEKISEKDHDKNSCFHINFMEALDGIY